MAMSGAAIATLGSRISIYLAFTLPMLIATIFRLVLATEPVYLETGLLTLVGFTFLIYAAFKNSLNINQLLQRTQEINLAQKDIITRLAMAGEYKDNDTGQHVKRMSHSCYLLALKAGLSNEKSEQLFMASALHDIGKIGIPDKILLNPEKLNKDDWEIMTTHTSIGEHILCNHNSPIMGLAAKIAAGHHERWNGKGYPLGISGKKIPIEIRIVSICDTFDALISKRPYKKAWPIDKALKYIKEESGQHFDPHLLALFIEIVPEIIEYAEQHSDTELLIPVNEITTKIGHTNVNLNYAKLS